MNKQELLEYIKKSRCAVLGMGVSNIPLVRFLLSLGVSDITVHDRKDLDKLGSVADEFLELGVRFVTGENYLDKIDADVIFRSPGIRDDKGGIPEAVRLGAMLTSEMELFFELSPAKIIAITGSDGKTTTTTLTYKMLECELSNRSGKQGRVFVGGNIGAPLLPRIHEMREKDYAVVELSSFQLKTMKKSPFRAVITNITPNHLDWHTGMDEYIESKLNICRYPELTRVVLNAENDITSGISGDVMSEVTLFSSKKTSAYEFGKDTGRFIFERNGEIVISDGMTEQVMLKTKDIKLVGRHNVENYMAAIGVTQGLVSRESIESVARTFGGVEHRLEFVRELDGVRYYNSSIDSTPTRTAAALSALDEKPIMICGGYDKHIPFDTLGDTLCRRAKAVVLTGETRNMIMSAISSSEFYAESELVVKICEDFEGAVQQARALAESGDIVLLSPACASFDAFENFEVRGRFFKKLVNSMV